MSAEANPKRNANKDIYRRYFCKPQYYFGACDFSQKGADFIVVKKLDFVQNL